MIKTMRATIAKHTLIEYGDKIVVAVSGGADSVALLHGLYMLKEEMGLTLTVCHLNHNLRGEDSDGDAKYVKDLCEALNITAYIYSEDIELYSKNMKLSFEEGAREARYRLFNEVLKKTASNKIAVAQNMNDQAETILMRLTRGAGLEGLTAIHYKRDNIIRPILSVDRDAIESYCKQNKLAFRTDHTNFETLYTRNKVRLELIPYLKENFNDNIIHQLFVTTELLKTDSDYLKSEASKTYKEIVSSNDKGLKIGLKPFNKCHLSIKTRIIRRLIKDLMGDIKGVSLVQIDEIIEMCNKSCHGSHKMIKKFIKLEISYKSLLVYDVRNKFAYEEMAFDIKEDLPIKGGILTASKDLKSSRDNDNIITIDQDKIKGQLIVRNRKTGDRFTSIGMKGSKKIKDLFIDLKIPAKDRDDVMLLCDDERIVWIIGYRMSEYYKLDTKTLNRLTIEYKAE